MTEALPTNMPWSGPATVPPAVQTAANAVVTLRRRSILLVALQSDAARRFLAVTDGVGLMVRVVPDLDAVAAALEDRWYHMIVVASDAPCTAACTAAGSIPLPGMDRETAAELPVMIVRSAHDPESRAAALMAGFGECVGLDLGRGEVLARMARVLAISPTGDTDIEPDAPLRINGSQVRLRERIIIMPEGRHISMTIGESAILETLLAANGLPVARTTLSQALVGRGGSDELRAVDMLIHRLRLKLDPRRPYKTLQSITGLGYRLVRPTAED